MGMACSDRRNLRSRHQYRRYGFGKEYDKNCFIGLDGCVSRIRFGLQQYVTSEGVCAITM